MCVCVCLFYLFSSFNTRAHENGLYMGMGDLDDSCGPQPRKVGHMESRVWPSDGDLCSDLPHIAALHLVAIFSAASTQWIPCEEWELGTEASRLLRLRKCSQAKKHLTGSLSVSVHPHVSLPRAQHPPLTRSSPVGKCRGNEEIGMQLEFGFYTYMLCLD